MKKLSVLISLLIATASPYVFASAKSDAEAAAVLADQAAAKATKAAEFARKAADEAGSKEEKAPAPVQTQTSPYGGSTGGGAIGAPHRPVKIKPAPAVTPEEPETVR